MNELKDKLMELGRAISQERKGVFKSSTAHTDEVLKQCIELLSASNTHVHDVQQDPMSEKELDLVLVSHAKHRMLRKGCFALNESGKYLLGHMDGQRAMYSMANGLSVALQQFMGAHRCTDSDGNTCPTHRHAQQAIDRFKEWESPLVASAETQTLP